MPQLNATTAQAVADAEDGFKPVDAGIYILQLMEDVTVAEGAKGPYWSWKLEIPKTDPAGNELPSAGRRFFTNTSLSEAAFFKLKETFGAFGVPTTTDTALLVGKMVRAYIVKKVITAGSRTGEIGNEISKLFPLDGPIPDGIVVTQNALFEKSPATAAANTPAASPVLDNEPLF